MKKIAKLLLLPLIAVFVLSNVGLVKADDDHKSEHDEKTYKDDEYRDKYSDDEDDNDDEYEHETDDDYGDYDSSTNSNGVVDFQQTQNGDWKLWTRDVGPVNQNELPIKSPANVKINIQGKVTNIFAVPTGGQIYLPAKQVAELFGANVKEYSKSGIMEMQKQQTQLIVRIGSNAAYENMVKTPMPGVAIQYQNKLHIPISVIANAFQYRVEWDEVNQTFLLQNQ